MAALSSTVSRSAEREISFPVDSKKDFSFSPRVVLLLLLLLHKGIDLKKLNGLKDRKISRGQFNDIFSARWMCWYYTNRSLRPIGKLQPDIRPLDCHISAEERYYHAIAGATNKEEIHTKVLAVKEPSIVKLTGSVACEPWNWRKDSIFRNKNLLYVSLRALKDGLLTQEEVGTLNLFYTTALFYQGSYCAEASSSWSCFRPGEPRAFCLFEDEEINCTSLNALMIHIDKFHKNFRLNDAQVQKFFGIVKSKSFLEQTFLVVDHNLPDAHKGKKLMHHILDTKPKFNVLGMFKDEIKKVYHVIPSFSMMVAYREVLFPESFTTMCLRFGETSTQDIARDILFDRRTMNVPHPLVKPDLIEADGHFAFSHLYTKHDFYHFVVSAAVPFSHKLLFLQMYLQLSHKVLNRFIMIDMEHLDYLNRGIEVNRHFAQRCEEIFCNIGKRENRERHVNKLCDFLGESPLAQSLKV